MRSRARVVVIVFALCAGFGQVEPGFAAAGHTASRVPIRQTAAGLVVVPVSINGRGAYPFLLDTGAESTIVDPALADELGLVAAGRLNLMTSTGVVGVDVARASIVFGAVEAHDVQVLQMPLDAVRAYASDVRGVLGTDVLRQSNWLLDYERGAVTQDLDGDFSQDAGSRAHRLAIRWVDGRAAVRADLAGVKTDLVLDSAASRLLLFEEPERRPGIADVSAPISIQSLSGQERVRAVTIESLRLGSFAVPRVTAAVLTSASPKPKEGGVLPTTLFGSVYFDYRADRVIVTPAR